MRLRRCVDCGASSRARVGPSRVSRVTLEARALSLSPSSGVFALTSADCLGRGAPLEHGQRDMRFLRRKLTLDVLDGADAEL